MTMLLPLFSFACLALPVQVDVANVANEGNLRVPFTEGLQSIYHDACVILCEEDADAACMSECIDGAVAAVLEENDTDEYQSCDKLGGMLASRIAPCAEATKALACLSEETTPFSLLDSIQAAAAQCSGAVLCGDKEPTAAP